MQPETSAPARLKVNLKRLGESGCCGVGSHRDSEPPSRRYRFTGIQYGSPLKSDSWSHSSHLRGWTCCLLLLHRSSRQLLTAATERKRFILLLPNGCFYYSCCCLTITEITAGGAVLLHQLAPAVAIAFPSPARTYKKAVQTSWKRQTGFRGRGGGIRPQLSLSNKKKLVHQSAFGASENDSPQHTLMTTHGSFCTVGINATLAFAHHRQTQKSSFLLVWTKMHHHSSATAKIRL